MRNIMLKGSNLSLNLENAGWRSSGGPFVLDWAARSAPVTYPRSARGEAPKRTGRPDLYLSKPPDFNIVYPFIRTFVGDFFTRKQSRLYKLPQLAMTAILQSFACFFSLSIAFALPSNLVRLPLAKRDVESIPSEVNTTIRNPLIAQPVACLDTRRLPTLVPSDCGYVLNFIILQKPNVFAKRVFISNSYRTEARGYARSRWQYGSCEVSVYGPPGARQLLTFLEVAFTADNIVRECVTGFVDPIGGMSLVGEASEAFYVYLRGYVEPESISAKNSTTSQRPAVSVSRRTIRSQKDSENGAGSQRVETRDPSMGASRVSNLPAVTSNSTLSPAALPRYPVNCFNPFIIHLQPAAATDCGVIINQVILRLFDPTSQLNFGFTDAADVDLSKPEYQKWQYGQCMISVKNNNVAQVDIFRLLDVATTARRISTQCLVNTQDKIGGVASIGTDGRGFYVYVGGRLASSPALSDLTLLRESTGAESF